MLITTTHTDVADMSEARDAGTPICAPAPIENAPLFETSIRRGSHVCGTPLGLGERQAFELVDGTTVVVEVIGYEPDRRAVVRYVSPAPIVQARFIHEVEPVEGVCVYTAGYELEVPPDFDVDHRREQEWRCGGSGDSRGGRGRSTNGVWPRS